jgi:hypothetical protein
MNVNRIVEGVFNAHGVIVSIVEYFVYLERILTENETFKHN